MKGSLVLTKLVALQLPPMHLNTRGMVHAPRPAGTTRPLSSAPVLQSATGTVALKRDEKDKGVPQLCTAEGMA